MGQRMSVHPSTQHLPRAGTQVPGPWHSGTHDRCGRVDVFIEDTGTQRGRNGPWHPPSILLGSQHQSLPEKGQGPGASYGQLRSARLCSLRTRSWTSGTWTSSSGGLRGGQSHEAPTEVPVFPSLTTPRSCHSHRKLCPPPNPERPSSLPPAVHPSLPRFWIMFSSIWSSSCSLEWGQGDCEGHGP